MPKISKKLQGYLDELERLAWTSVSTKTSDSDFIAVIHAINQYCTIADSLGIDREDLRKHMNTLYTEFSRRVYAKCNIQDAYELILCLKDFIFGRSIDDAYRGNALQIALMEMLLKTITAYRKNPTLHPYQYVTLLKWYAVQSRDKSIEASAKAEVVKIVNQQIRMLGGAKDHSDEELMKSILLRNAACDFVTLDRENDFRWTDLLQLLIERVNVKTLTDEQLLLWLRTASLIEDWPYDLTIPVDEVLPNVYKELVHRKSLANNIEVLEYQACTELKHIKAVEAKREATKEDKTFSDDFLHEVLPIKIGESLSTESLLSLYNIYLSRYKSISCLIGGNTRSIKNFCKRRHAEIFSILSSRLIASEDIYQKIKILDAMLASEAEFGQLGTTKDAKCFVGRAINALLENASELPKLAELQLTAMRYSNYDYDGISEAADCERLEECIPLLQETLAENADLQTLITFRKAINALDRREYKKYDIETFCNLTKLALDSKDVSLLSALVPQFGWYWHQGANTCHYEICAIAETLSQLAEVAEDKLMALAASKFIAGRYEVDILNVEIPYEGVELYANFDAEEVIDWLKYLMAKSKRTGDSQVKLIRDILSALYKEILSDEFEMPEDSDDEDDAIFCGLNRNIATQSLATLLDIDLYLSTIDADHVDSEECVNACDIAHELDRRSTTDTLAATALTRYRKSLMQFSLSEVRG